MNGLIFTHYFPKKHREWEIDKWKICSFYLLFDLSCRHKVTYKFITVHLQRYCKAWVRLFSYEAVLLNVLLRCYGWYRSALFLVKFIFNCRQSLGVFDIETTFIYCCYQVAIMILILHSIYAPRCLRAFWCFFLLEFRMNKLSLFSWLSPPWEKLMKKMWRKNTQLFSIIKTPQNISVNKKSSVLAITITANCH